MGLVDALDPGNQRQETDSRRSGFLIRPFGSVSAGIPISSSAELTPYCRPTHTGYLLGTSAGTPDYSDRILVVAGRALAAS